MHSTEESVMHCGKERCTVRLFTLHFKLRTDVAQETMYPCTVYICAIVQHRTLHIGCALATAQKKQCTDTAQEAVPAHCTSKVHLIVSQTANLKYCTDVAQEAMHGASKGRF